MQNENNKRDKGFELTISPELEHGLYSNLALISHSHSDFILDFSYVMPGMEKPKVFSRIILAPEHAKRLLAALQDNIMKYEREFGEIEIQGAAPRTISPFGNGKGEA